MGIGPGSQEDLTYRAAQAIDKADLLVGYTPYLQLVQKMSCYHGQKTYTTGMTREIDRVKHAVDAARRGEKVAVVSSGDPGVYSMVGLVLETMDSSGVQVPVEIVPGISAANAASARLGAPLMQDYANISLSDLLTPLPDILDRVEAAARANFVIVFYNPRSTKRHEPWNRAISILRQHRLPETPVGIVQNAGRDGESIMITCLAQIEEFTPDMLSTVVIGNSLTRVSNGRMITPRGYKW